MEEIDFYRNFKCNVIDTWKEIVELNDVVSDLENAIMIAGLEDEQQFLIIPPSNKHQTWKYWKFAMWIPGQEEHTGLNNYFKSVIEFLDTQLFDKGTE